MSFELSTIAEKVVPAAITGLGTAALSLWRFGSGVMSRLEKLEAAVAPLPTRLDAEVASLRKEVKELRDELDQFDGSIRSRASKKETAGLSERLIGLEARLAQAEEGIVGITTSLKHHIQEQQEQWNTVHRTLGQIEGFLKGMISKKNTSESGHFPPMKK